jgi:hypothetical protein
MNKGLKFGLILSGIYFIFFALVFIISILSKNILIAGLLYLFILPFGIMWDSNFAYILNALLYFGIGFLIGFIIEKVKGNKKK